MTASRSYNSPPAGGAQVLARFENGIRVTEAGDGRPPVVIATPTPRPTNTPTFTPTLDGVYATVLSQALNVRTGPSTVYDILGQLRNGEQVRLIGANLDLTWGVLNFRGLQGWISLAPNLASVAGDLRTLPVVAAPPTPTPGPTSTPAPTATPSQPDVVVLSAVPAVITWGTLTNVSVTVQNAGARPDRTGCVRGQLRSGRGVQRHHDPGPGVRFRPVTSHQSPGNLVRDNGVLLDSDRRGSQQRSE
ncbi:MAG: SH3 domain-containing protein [Chloroflexi bacterium]|nr:SH3 domain-containing protein [Chloroflexota bacterium]